MVAIYVDWITRGKMTIDNVPARWREDVRKVLQKSQLSNSDNN